MRRVIDVAGAVAGLVLLSPVLLVVAVVVMATSRGGAFHRAVRVGRGGRPFTLYKFRTMRVAAGPAITRSGDPRVTWVGAWLRKTKIDELPQLFNVLKGEMAIVGPRPPLPSEVVRYEMWHRRRLSVIPGLTCLWQVNGRNDIDFNTWMKLDMQYIDEHSLWLDLKIIAKTVPAMLRGR